LLARQRCRHPHGPAHGPQGQQLCSPPANELVADRSISLSPDTGAINSIRCRLSESLAALVEEAAETIRWEQVAHMDETGGPIGNADAGDASHGGPQPAAAERRSVDQGGHAGRLPRHHSADGDGAAPARTEPDLKL